LQQSVHNSFYYGCAPGHDITALQEEGHTVARIEVPKSSRLVATSDGLLQRRRLQSDGTPQCAPFYPHEFASRQSDLGIIDYSSLPVTGSSVADFGPLERERLRQLIERYGGDRTVPSRPLANYYFG
jgi:ATP-dependent DNA helicase RecG